MARRLAAILAADVVGYSRLMGADEAGTLARLKSLRKDLVQPKITGRDGRIVKLMGDGLLAAFPSVVEAVQCAVDIQESVTRREVDLPDERRIRLRIGVNLGDVIVEGSDIYGDGVNVAARLETLADPGGICVSGTVFDHVRGKVDLDFIDHGEQQVKNIEQPVRVYEIALDRGVHADEVAGPVVTGAAPPKRPDKPSIAVLPFANLSNDPEQDYFADGMVEDIITGLSRFSQLFVIARNSTFTYKVRSVDVRQVAAELNVRYVLEGSVRKSGDRVRITGQLIDAESGGHVWADRFDGELLDLFDLQDRITEAVVGVIEPSIQKSELERVQRESPENMDAYDLYLRSLPLAYALERSACAQAFELLERAIDLDPDFVPVLALSAWCLEQSIVRGWPQLTGNDREIATDRARAVLSVGTKDANAIAMAGFALQMVARDFTSGRSAALRALKLNPNSVIVQMFAGLTLVWGGDADLAQNCFEKAITLSPADPGMAIFLLGIATVHLALGRYEEAIEVALQSAALHPRESNYWTLIAAYASLGQENEVRSTLKELQLLNPNANARRYWQELPIKDPKIKSAIAKGLAIAQLPE